LTSAATVVGDDGQPQTFSHFQRLLTTINTIDSRPSPSDVDGVLGTRLQCRVGETLMLRWFTLTLMAGFISMPASAEVVAIEVTDQRPWIPGRAFGAGEYELLTGRVRYEVDPASASSRDITDVHLAPRNARGNVEFHGPFLLLRPRDAARANGTTVFEFANRGRDQSNGLLFQADNFALSKNETREVSRSTLFDMGYTFAWAGWQGDLQANEFGLTVPSVPVTGSVRAAAFLGWGHARRDGGDFSQEAPCVLEGADATAVLRIHRSLEDPGEVMPRAAWRFARRAADGRVVDDRCAFLLATPVDRPTLVTIVFTAGPPKVMGLGQAALRDFASHLKHGDTVSALNRHPAYARRLIGYGYSQGGRLIRDFLYRGFNADARGRRVLDGVLDTASGAGRGSFNHRYALPGEAGNSVRSHLRAVDLYPFADLPTPDIAGLGPAEGLLDRARRDGVQPRLFHVLNSTEYWARAGSLLHTTVDGSQPMPEAEGTRTYAFAGTAHAPQTSTLFLERSDRAALPYNDNDDLALALPALLVGLDKWISAGAEPPPSTHPRLGSTLVPPDKLKFPAVPGVAVPTGPPPRYQLGLGRDYRSQGVITEPPQIGTPYVLLVPQVDADGNELGAWRGLAQSVPLGTYTAWNPQDPALLPFGFISGLRGAFIPFPATAAAGARFKDPRRSIAERYVGVAGYMAMVERAIEAQVAAGFLLPQDRGHARSTMRIYWDRVDRLRAHWPLRVQ